MDLRARQWAYVNRDGDRYLCVNLDDERIAVLLGSAGAEVWYFIDSGWTIEAIQVPDVTTLATMLTDLSVEDLSRLQAFCSEPRTMQEIEDEFQEAEAWYLRKLGILHDVGKKGRQIASEWAGLDFDALMDNLGERVREAQEDDNRNSGR